MQKKGIEFNLRQEVFADEGALSDSSEQMGIVIEIEESNEQDGKKILEECEEITVDQLEKDYYLFEFSDNELIEVLKKPDEWNQNDYYWSYDILRLRGKEPSVEQIKNWRKERYEDLSRPQKVTAKYIRNGYIACILGGFIGIFMGRHLSHSPKVLPDGKKVPAFDEHAQKIGVKMSIIGSIMLILWLTIILYFTIFNIN